MKDAFADLHEDLKQCIPVFCRDILALDGRFNVAAHFPKNSGVGPDLGKQRIIVLTIHHSKDITSFLRL